MSTRNEISILKRHFELKSIHISDYWLQCCLEWFKGEYDTYTEEFLCKTVYHQWLDTDLRDIEVRSLPINISKMKKNIINGNYAVQVMYLKDISKPAYSQLKNMRDMYKLTRFHVDKENESTEATGKRVLNLNMTDGIQCVNGFEYETVSCLNLYMTPGIKILLIGPLVVRNGEFLFKQNNIKILGGEVENLKITNAPENILSRELNMPENNNPRVNKEQIENSVKNSIPANSLFTNNEINNIHSTNSNFVNNEQKNTNIEEFEDDLLLLNFASNFEEETTNEIQINDVFINSDISFSSNKTFLNKQILTDSIDDAALADLNIENLEEVEKQDVYISNNTNSIRQDLSDIVDDTALANFNYENLEKIEKRELKNKLNKEIDQDSVIERIRSIVLPIIDTPNPFIYIKYLFKNSNKLLNNKNYRVKARFGNNIEKIKLSKNKGWNMKFEIRDASGILVVDFLSEVIEKLMELSPAEALAENRSVKYKECSSHEKLTESLAKCKDKLKFGEYLMDLQFNKEKNIFTIVNLEHITKQHLEQIKCRVQSVPVQLL